MWEGQGTVGEGSARPTGKEANVPRVDPHESGKKMKRKNEFQL